MNLTSVQDRIAQLSRAAAGFWSCAFVLAFTGCGLFDLDHDDRIVMGRSIDGVKIYDSPAVVQNKLGQPSSIAIGDFAGFIYEYGEGEPAGLRILLAEPFHETAIQVTARSPYRGTTKEGVGIGTSQRTVRKFLGSPDSTSVSTYWHSLGTPRFAGDVYLYDSLAFVFSYDQDNLVESIRMILRKEEEG